jgi:hypothetical protein
VSKEALISEQKLNQLERWHRKLGHINEEDSKKIPKICDGVDLGKICKRNGLNCATCAKTKKQVRLPFQTIREREQQDLCK